MKSLILLGLLTFSSLGLAAENFCEGKAKYGAIRAYHAEMGTVQGSNGIQYSSKLVDNLEDNQASYLIDIYDSNEDGDSWNINYLIIVIKNKNDKCMLSSVNKIGVVVF